MLAARKSKVNMYGLYGYRLLAEFAGELFRLFFVLESFGGFYGNVYYLIFTLSRIYRKVLKKHTYSKVYITSRLKRASIFKFS